MFIYITIYIYIYNYIYIYIYNYIYIYIVIYIYNYIYIYIYIILYIIYYYLYIQLQVYLYIVPYHAIPWQFSIYQSINVSPNDWLLHRHQPMNPHETDRDFTHDFGGPFQQLSVLWLGFSWPYYDIIWDIWVCLKREHVENL